MLIGFAFVCAARGAMDRREKTRQRLIGVRIGSSENLGVKDIHNAKKIF